MEIGRTKLKKGNNRMVHIGYETKKEMNKSRTTVQAKLKENSKIMETPQIKPKLKVINIDEEEIGIGDNDLATIKKQNKLDDVHIRISKKINKSNDLSLLPPLPPSLPLPLSA